MSEFANRVVLITGAGQGIGRQLALELAREGALIAAIDLQAETLGALATELGSKLIRCAVADVTDRPALLAQVAELEQQLAPVDLLIANAGIGRETSGVDFRAEDIEAQVRVNLIGVANSVAAVLPGMLARRHGHLVVISSLAAFRGIPRMAGYCASKAGVNALFDALRVELGPHGIDVTTLCPGWIRTPLTAQVTFPMPGLLEVEEGVRQMVEAIRRRRRFFAFPRESAWRLAMLRWLPTAWGDWLLARQFRRMVGGK